MQVAFGVFLLGVFLLGYFCVLIGRFCVFLRIANAKIRPAGQKMKMQSIFILFASAAKKVFLQGCRKTVPTEHRHEPLN